MDNIIWNIEQAFMQIDRLMGKGQIQQARMVLQNLLEYIRIQIMNNPALLQWLSAAGLSARMAQLGFTTAEIAAVTTTVATAEGTGMAAGGATGLAAFFAGTVVVAGVTLTVAELLGIALLIMLIMGILVYGGYKLAEHILETFPRTRQWLFGY